MFVKICGLTNLADSLAAVEAGALAVGFNFVSSSPRYITESFLSEWIDKLPTHVWKVGVFANQTSEHVSAVCKRLRLDVAQLHGEESPKELPAELRIWKAFRLRSFIDEHLLSRFTTEAILLDGPSSGISFDWSAVRPNGRKVILAGGLHAGNVREAIARVAPWGVDVCSRIESQPGLKDHRLMTQFVQTALSC